MMVAEKVEMNQWLNYRLRGLIGKLSPKIVLLTNHEKTTTITRYRIVFRIKTTFQEEK